MLVVMGVGEVMLVCRIHSFIMNEYFVNLL